MNIFFIATVVAVSLTIIVGVYLVISGSVRQHKVDMAYIAENAGHLPEKLEWETAEAFASRYDSRIRQLLRDRDRKVEADRKDAILDAAISRAYTD